MLRTCLLLAVMIARDCSSQEDNEPYKGKLIGKFNSYHHQVSGEVYAVDERTLLLVNFNYDGTGEDAFFWAGDSGRPGPQGFIIPDEHGKTNVLERYYNAEVRLALPDGKRVSRLRWVAVYDLAAQSAFADVALPDDFEPPGPAALAPLQPAPAAPTPVSSGQIRIIDAATLMIPEFRYDGSATAQFWAGTGPVPSPRGHAIPDERGYLEPLRRYNAEDVRLELPAPHTVFTLDWIAVLDTASKTILASALFPSAPNVPPSPRAPLPHRAALPHCRQLHRDYQLAWEVFGSQITIQLTGKIEEHEYLAFGISGSPSEAVMLGSDVAVARWDAHLRQGHATDYNITDYTPCVQSLGLWRGVCRDSVAGALDSNQVIAASREDGLTAVTYRRLLQPAEAADLPWPTERPASVVWAVGALDADAEPALHRLYPRRALLLNLTQLPHHDCVPFTVGSPESETPWDIAELFDPGLRVFEFQLGPAGGPRGLAARHPRTAPPLAWYVNGQLAPDIQVRRGLKYTFLVRGGRDPHRPAHYHPLVVSTLPRGGLDRPGGHGRAHAVLAGASVTRRARLAPTAAGPLCLARLPAGADPRRAGRAASFREYNRSLEWSCEPGPPARLDIAPNASWPDIVYYDSFTHADMGGRIFVVDRHKRNLGRRPPGAASTAPRPAPHPALCVALTLALPLTLTLTRSLTLLLAPRSV